MSAVEAEAEEVTDKDPGSNKRTVAGFFEDRSIGPGEFDRYDKTVLALGSSHVFCSKLGHNRDTLPSRLSAILSDPFFGVSFPEADSRSRALSPHGPRELEELAS